jgi:hypothetical protein|nr:MAG TPA_asm: hypothetical protein [Caudoviricetes sp.]
MLDFFDKLKPLWKYSAAVAVYVAETAKTLISCGFQT